MIPPKEQSFDKSRLVRNFLLTEVEVLVDETVRSVTKINKYCFYLFVNTGTLRVAPGDEGFAFQPATIDDKRISQKK